MKEYNLTVLLMELTYEELETVRSLETVSQYHFNDPALALQALTHRSYVSERGQSLKDNERLEFLGDAALELAVSALLYGRYPERSEGDLTRMRAWLVNEEQLSLMSLSMGIGQLLLLGKGESMSGGREKPSILSDSFEAVIGALYLDGGFGTVMDFVMKKFEVIISRAPEMAFESDAKTTLQEFTQAKFQQVPTYEVTDIHGPDHARIFNVALSIEGKQVTTGSGKSKKEAEQQAAAQALIYFRTEEK